MRSLSGLVLDVYDDVNGDVLRSIYPTPSTIPSVVKQAHLLSPEERFRYPSDVFSLVIHQDEAALRKFACIDPGNTILSVEYFLRTHHKLPEEAIKVAAANLATACSWYGLPENRHLYKLAGIGGALLGAAKSIGSKVVNNPLGALGTAMAGLSIYGAGKEMAGNLKQVARSAPGTIQQFHM